MRYWQRGVDSVREQEELDARRMLEKPHRTSPSSARCVGPLQVGRIVTFRIPQLDTRDDWPVPPVIHITTEYDLALRELFSIQTQLDDAAHISVLLFTAYDSASRFMWREAAAADLGKGICAKPLDIVS